MFQPRKHLRAFRIFVLYSCLISTSAAMDASNFNIFKNTGLRPCDLSPPPGNLSEILATAKDYKDNHINPIPGPDNTLSASITNQTAFCALFWDNYTIIASTPKGSAFLEVSYDRLIQLALYYITAISNTIFIGDSPLTVLTIPFLIYDTAKYIFWWIQFVHLAQDRSSVGSISTLAWLSTAGYIALTIFFAPLTWIPYPVVFVLAVAQFICTCVSLSILWNPVANYILDITSGTTMVGNCSVERVLANKGLVMDPNALASLKADAIVFGVSALFLIVMLIIVYAAVTGAQDRWFREDIVENGTWPKIVWGVLIGFMGFVYVSPLFSSLHGLPLFTTVVWWEECRVVHVLMAQVAPSYLDVRILGVEGTVSKVWRSAKLAFGN